MIRTSPKHTKRNTVVTVSMVGAIVSITTIAMLVAQGGRSWQSRTTWAEYGGGPDGSHFSALTQINKKNIGQLEIAWTYPAQGAGQYSPLVAGRLAYVISSGNIVALDAATGREIWMHDPRGDGSTPVASSASEIASGRGDNATAAAGASQGRDGRGGFTGVGQRGLNYWQSKDGTLKRLIFQAGGYLRAVDAITGKTIESFGDHGKVDLRTGIDVNWGQPVTTRTGGRIFEDLFLLGSATGEGYVSPSGDLRAFNVVTGKLAWVFHTVPHPGEPGDETWPPDAWKYIGGVNTWGEITVDVETGIAYFPLGSPTYDFYGADRKGNGLYGNCLLALDARTGKYKWHFQLIHHDLWDYDAVSAPQLITIKHNGRTISAVAQASKQGFLYVFDRVTGQPVWPIEERPVPKSAMPGEHASPTQPFPTAPPPFARQSFTANEIDTYFLSPEEQAYWKARIANAVNEGLYTPPAFNKDAVYMPGHNGGNNFFGAASNPEKGFVYVVSKEVPGLIRVGDTPIDRNSSEGNPPTGRAIAADPSSGRGALAGGPAPGPPADGMGRPDRPYPEGIPTYTRYRNLAPVGGLYPTIISPPWSTLTAYDLNTGKITWQVPYGDAENYAGPARNGELRGNIFPKSGPVVTASGLIFFASNEAKLRVLDADSGKEIRAPIELPRGSQGVPAVYELDGRQFILLNATGAPATIVFTPPPVKAETQPGAYVAVAVPKGISSTDAFARRK